MGCEGRLVKESRDGLLKHVGKLFDNLKLHEDPLNELAKIICERNFTELQDMVSLVLRDYGCI